MCETIVLYDQMDNPGANATVSQMFEPANAAFNNQGADDFVVPETDAWTVTQVVAGGVYFNGPGPSASFNVTFYSDTAGFPGAAVPGGTYTGLAYTNVPAGTFTITLSTPLLLAPGTYWVSVQANMNFTPFGEGGWNDRTVTSNSAAVWQNPAGGFGTSCTAYGRRGASCGIDPTAPDQIFQVMGCRTGLVNCGPLPVGMCHGICIHDPNDYEHRLGTCKEHDAPVGCTCDL